MAQMAAAIAILQAVPLRLGNLARLDMRKNLIARGKRVYLVVPEGDTKNGEPVDFELPAETVDIVGLVHPGLPPASRARADGRSVPGRGKRSESGLRTRTADQGGGLSIHRPEGQHALVSPCRREDLPGSAARANMRSSDRSCAIDPSRRRQSFYAGAETRSAGQHYASVINRLREELNQNQPAPRVRGGRTISARLKQQEIRHERRSIRSRQSARTRLPAGRSMAGGGSAAMACRLRRRRHSGR